MAQQDKTDWYWNGVLAGAVNNLYYDLINVDVERVPYSRTHRNSSFFLKTRLGYIPEPSMAGDIESEVGVSNFTVTDIKTVWLDRCATVDERSGHVYIMVATQSYKKKRVFVGNIVDGCYQDNSLELVDEMTVALRKCGDWKFFKTDFVTGEQGCHGSNGIQVNSYENGITKGYFSTPATESSGTETCSSADAGDYLVITSSLNNEDSGFAGQVRMVTGHTSTGRLMVDSAWMGFKTLTQDYVKDVGYSELFGYDLTYSIYKRRGEVVGYSDDQNIKLITLDDPTSISSNFDILEFEDIGSNSSTSIIGVADASNKIFILTDNGFVHYNKDSGYMNKFFINDDMDAGTDKTSLTSYRDFILAFGHEHISVGVPDTSNEYWTMYNQATNIGVRSRYSYAEYEGDLIFVSNDKRLLALGVASNVGRYMLQHEDVGEKLNGKLATLIESDEVYVGSYGNNLRVFVLTKNSPYKISGGDVVEDDEVNNMTHIYKFDTLFKVWSEDHLDSILMTGVYEGLWYGRNGVYIRGVDKNTGEPYDQKKKGTSKVPVKTIINAYLIENESDWIGATNSRLKDRPKLYNLAKLNRLITTLGPGIYSNSSKIKVTTYVKGIGLTYEYPLGGDSNDWIGMITDMYTGSDTTIDQCIIDGLKQDSQAVWEPCSTSSSKLKVQSLIPDKPWCNGNKGYMLQEHGVCINDTLYELAPTMPLVTKLGENQDYATQIKLELIGDDGDIICFGGWLAELFVAPLFSTGPDGEYQLVPNTDC